MKLSDFEKTKYSGLYVSKKTHPIYGDKFILRFQYNRKRHVKVIGYTNKDNLSLEKAYKVLQGYKNSLQKEEPMGQFLNAKEGLVKFSRNSQNLDNIVNEYKKMKGILGTYKNLNTVILREGIQKIYDLEEIKSYQIELIKMQNYLEATNKKMIILFEGRDASGKGGAIRRITRYMNNKHYRIVALGKPSDTQKSQWFFQRYIEHFPTGGEVVLFDRSWYNRAMVEPIFGFCTKKEYDIFMEDVNNFERDLVRQDIILVKLYFSVSKDEQLRRFERRMSDPLRQWKLSEVDLQAQDLWKEFSDKKYEMLKRTSSNLSPWHIVRSDDKHKARVEAVKIILNSLDYDGRDIDLNYQANEKINISIQKELARMRKNQDY